MGLGQIIIGHDNTYSIGDSVAFFFLLRVEILDVGLDLIYLLVR